MTKYVCLSLFFTFLFTAVQSQTASYIYSIDFYEQGDNLVITYDLAPLRTGQYYVVSISCQMGKYTLQPSNEYLYGDIGNVITCNSRRITWQAKRDLGEFNGQISITLNADLYEVQQAPSPPKDSDGDGIADAQDACPNEKGSAAYNGCPPPVPAPSTTSEYTENAASTFIVMKKIPGGTFTMGSNDSEADINEKPTHTVTVSGFYMGKYEVTQKQWRAIMGTNPSYFKNCDDCPVERVSWKDVQTFITKLNKKSGREYRLATEAEWEYAARGGQSYKYAGSDNIDNVAWYGRNSGSNTHSVGQKTANGYGLYDMSGNVYEWCADWWYGSYSSSSQTNPTGPSSGSCRVIRGGDWNGFLHDCCVANRSFDLPARRIISVGFRLVSPQ